MSFANKANENQIEDDEDDSFYSFEHSLSDPSDLYDVDEPPKDEPDGDINAQSKSTRNPVVEEVAGIPESSIVSASVQNLNQSSPRAKWTPIRTPPLERSNSPLIESIACDPELPTTSVAMLNLSQYRPQPKATPARSPPLMRCLYSVPRPDGPIPGEECFNMDDPKSDPLNISPQREASQKYNYTEKWVERQQNPIRYFQSALEGHSDRKNSDQNEEPLSDTQLRKKPIEPTSVPINPATLQPYADTTEPYVSPFEDFVPEEKKLPSGYQTGPVVYVPAGYDLTNLVEYKNPNHWHRRPSTLNDSRP